MNLDIAGIISTAVRPYKQITSIIDKMLLEQINLIVWQMHHNGDK